MKFDEWLTELEEARPNLREFLERLTPYFQDGLFRSAQFEADVDSGDFGTDRADVLEAEAHAET